MVTRRIAYTAIVTIDIARRCTLGAVITQPRYSGPGYQYARIYKTGNEIGCRESLQVFSGRIGYNVRTPVNTANNFSL
jgi:hypothetical protein